MLERLSAAHSAHGAPPTHAMLMCGDFNATPDSPALEELRSRRGFCDAFNFVDKPSFAKLPTGVGGTRIDYLLCKRAKPIPAAPPNATSAAARVGLGTSDLSELLRECGSDHAPLAASFELDRPTFGELDQLLPYNGVSPDVRYTPQGPQMQ